MKNNVVKCVVALGLLSVLNISIACETGTYGVGVKGSSTDDYWVNVYAGGGQYNESKEVKKNQYQEFCWASSLGKGSITKTSTDEVCARYNWDEPDPMVGYKEIYIDSDNWGRDC